MSVGVVRLANTVVTPSTTTTTTTSTTVAPLVTTTSTTIAADQLPATGRDENGLMFAVAVFGLGILLMGMRRRALR
jgi:LPXTG-motif cell wall-anchored protein